MYMYMYVYVCISAPACKLVLRLIVSWTYLVFTGNAMTDTLEKGVEVFMAQCVSAALGHHSKGQVSSFNLEGKTIKKNHKIVAESPTFF